MARGTLKNLKRARPTPGKASATADTGGPGSSSTFTPSTKDATSASPPVGAGTGGRDAARLAGGGLDGGDLVGWLNCECFFSLVLVGLLALLPLNLHTLDLLQTRETYVARAEELLSTGSFEKAAWLFERALTVEETPDGHLHLADSLARLSRPDEAVQHYHRAVDLYTNDKDKIETLVTIGKLHSSLGRADLALQSYGEVLKLQPETETPEVADAHYRVAVSLLDTNAHKYSEAIAHLEAATSISPTLASAHLLLANCLRHAGHPEKALTRYKKAIKYRPRDFQGLLAMASTHHELGNFKQALTVYKKALAVTPTAQEAKYAMAALQQQSFTPHRAPEAFVSLLFDVEARRRALHETLLASPWPPSDASLFHRIHGIVFAGVAQQLRTLVEATLQVSNSWHEQWFDVLELGCGRGDAAHEFRGLANRLVGVDLSKVALAQAAERGLYDELREQDLAVTLAQGAGASIDLVVACDSLPYFGNLSEILTSVAFVLRSAGAVALNLDVLEKPLRGSPGFVLRSTGRWSHTEAYLKATASHAGLAVVSTASIAQAGFAKQPAQPPTSRFDPSSLPQRTMAAVLQKL